MERIEAVAKQFDCNLILLSAKGEGDADDKYLGRVSSGIVKKIDIPVLIVPIVYRFRPIKSIVFSVKFKRVASPKVVEPLIKVATKFDAAVSVLHVKTPDFDPSRDENLFLDELPHKLYNLEGNFIFDTTKAFIEDHPIDMLVAIRRKRGFFKNIIFNNGTKKKTFNSEVPLLVLQWEKVASKIAVLQKGIFLSKSISMKSIFIIFSNFFVLCSLFAQADSIILPLVTITETKSSLYSIGNQTRIIDSSFLAENKTYNLSDLASKHTDVFINSYGPGLLNSPSARGSGSAHTVVLWNGFNIQSSMNGIVDFSLVPVGLFNEINIDYGGSGALFGSGAVGSTILLRQPK